MLSQCNQGILASFCLLFLLSGCGFEPVYGDNAAGSHSPLRGNLIVEPVNSAVAHESQMFKADLEDIFNPEGTTNINAQYHLKVVLTKNLIPAVVKSDGTIQRYDVRFDSTFTLSQVGVVKPIFTGTLRRSGSYNASITQEFTTYEAEQDVIERILKEMAEDYMLRLSGYFAGQSTQSVP